ncbi:MAG: DUF1275 domain-containing protein [Tissierellia bacterium]|jgi:uncharacterized membrane protein YoaK (UPF0700 family)|nr:DUF1275 domain-containing protein [Tissierellia bacterium]
MHYPGGEKPLTLWVLLLSFGSGYSNITAMMRFSQPVSHMTGMVSQLALAIYVREAFQIGRLLSVLFCFLSGAILAGYLFHQRKLEPKKRYGALLFIGGVIIFILKDSNILFYFLVFFMGLQNSLFLGYRGHIIRSTHVTGYISDVGFELGSSLAGTSTHPWKIGFYLFSILLFILGGISSVYFYSHGVQLELLSGTYVLLGSSYFYLRRRELFLFEKKA